MRRFKRNSRGQFVIIAAILIAALTLSLALFIHEVNLHRQQLSYQPVQELVLAVSSDLDRALTHSLSLATQKYYEALEGNVDELKALMLARKEGEKYIAQWKRSIIASYPHLGLNLTLQGSDAQFYADWGLDWTTIKGLGFSRVWSKFYMDVNAYGYKGWVGFSGKYVKLTIIPESIRTDGEKTILNFTIFTKKLSDDTVIPIPNLTVESLNKTQIQHQNVRRPEESSWISYQDGLRINSLKYLGSGIYTVTLNRPVSKHTHGIILTVETPEDNIIVSALYYRDIKYNVTLQSQEVNAASSNIGTINFNGTNYSLPHTLEVPPDDYEALYFPTEDYEFVNFTATGDVQTTRLNAKWKITVDGNGTLTAFYKLIPKINITLDSREVNGASQHKGSINFNGDTINNLPSIVKKRTNQNYAVNYEPEAGYYFWGWELLPIESGSYLDDWGSKSTILTVIENEEVKELYLTALYSSTPPPQININVILQSREKTYLEPTCLEESRSNLGQIKLGAIIYKLPNTATRNTILPCVLVYTPAEGFEFLNWTTTGNITVENANSPNTIVTIEGDGAITAFYTGCKVTLSSRQTDNSTFNLGLITLGSYTPPKLSWIYTGFPRGNHTLRYIPQSSAYQFKYWECTGLFTVGNFGSSYTYIKIYDDVNVTAVYGPPTYSPPSPEEWGYLYLCKNPSLFGDDAVLLTSDWLPNSYWTGKEGTLPIPPKPSTYYLNISSLPIPINLRLSTQVNVWLYIQLATGKADNITCELSFICNNTKYVIGQETFYNLVGEGWYHYSINTTEIDTSHWPYPYAAVIPEGSIIRLTIAIPPNQGTLHIIWSEEKPSRIDLL